MAAAVIAVTALMALVFRSIWKKLAEPISMDKTIDILREDK